MRCTYPAPVTLYVHDCVMPGRRRAGGKSAARGVDSVFQKLRATADEDGQYSPWRYEQMRRDAPARPGARRRRLTHYAFFAFFAPSFYLKIEI